MKRQIVLAALILGTAGLMSCTKKVELKSDEQKASYAIGQQVGSSLKNEGVQLDADIIGAAIGDVLKGEKSRLSPEEMAGAMQSMRTKIMEKQQKVAGENKEKAHQYMEENKKKPNVKTTASGLQYEIVTEGKGDTPKDTDQVKVHYKGTLIDGTEFDSSYKRNQPAVFPVGGVIPGWTEALKMMNPGSKWKLTVPPELAYGESGRPSIPPNSVLNFEVELLEIVKTEAPKPGAGGPATKQGKKGK